ncbi:metallophosphoesterase family protein [Helcococcus kunzii]|uniref:Phosphoesterase n=1 Tax=Helcococcus kunzii ATCC 51366 TaxID=883114 RepID=H3NNU5_9FIRM|nr:metallophosphoesterase [Helcococcus kunzii]EHR34070.1 MJ0936 family phosphodiesterase [Helcococcus kunzii ATCC 51366]MCT1795679.1 metallophosphoesterase [Helcococcus kunzii]MCT1988640.1 metallophosphoesterase [Helcococcus kunzii]QUY64918.1 metallophosphoesterase [Helcococcus kunzii]QZO75626.1 metallophosphoesterase [Helcococcus kunzii]
MKILVLSDTHGNNNPFIRQLKNHEDAELIIHLGDMVEDAKEIQKYAPCMVKVVRGNNDYYSDNTQWHELIRVKGHKILLTHGHLEGVSYGIDKLVQKAKQSDVEMVMYGHTHRYDYREVDGITVLNPGSAGYDRGGEYESFVILNVTEEKIDVERVKL